MRAAATDSFRQFDEQVATIKSGLARYRKLTRSADDPETALSEGELRLITTLPSAFTAANEEFAKLKALEHLVLESDRAAIIEEIADLDYPLKHDVTCLWGWFSQHMSLLKEGAPPQFPYSPMVGTRTALNGRRVDREFYYLWHFLHRLPARDGRKLLFFEKGETPDFVVLDSQGKAIGVEVGEAPISQSWADDQDERTPHLARLEQVLARNGLDATIFGDSPVDHVTVDAVEEHTQSARGTSEIGNLVLPGNRGTIAFKAGAGDVFTESGPEVGPYDSEPVAQAIARAVQKKLVKKNGQPRLKPRIDPCILVLYPNAEEARWREEIETVCEVATRDIGKSPNTLNEYFSEIWLTYESGLARVWPAPAS